jgi:hypothetical protein
MKNTFYLLSAVLILLSARISLSQELSLKIPSGELPSEFDEWGKKADQIIFKIKSPEGIKMVTGGHIVFDIMDDTGKIIASTRKTFDQQPVFGPEVNSGPWDWKQFINPHAIDIVGKPQSEHARIPEGSYQICAYIVNLKGQVFNQFIPSCDFFTVGK